MERAVSGLCADFSGIVRADRGGGAGTPPPAGLGEAHHGPTSGERPLAEYPPVVSVHAGQGMV